MRAVPADRSRTTSQTRLAELRVAADLSQLEMAKLTGLALNTYIRLERGEIANPPIRYLVNCAFVLGVDLDAVLEREWTRWTAFSDTARRPPRRSSQSGKVS